MSYVCQVPSVTNVTRHMIHWMFYWHVICMSGTIGDECDTTHDTLNVLLTCHLYVRYHRWRMRHDIWDIECFTDVSSVCQVPSVTNATRHMIHWMFYWRVICMSGTIGDECDTTHDTLNVLLTCHMYVRYHRWRMRHMVGPVQHLSSRSRDCMGLMVTVQVCSASLTLLIIHHLLPPHLFQLLCEVDVCHKFHPPSPVLHLLARQSLFSHKSTFTLSIHLGFGLPFLLLPSISTRIILFPSYSSSLLMTCTTSFLHFLGYFSHFRCISNSFIPYPVRLVTPNIHPNMLISVPSNFFSCAFFAAHVAGLTAVLHTLPLILLNNNYVPTYSVSLNFQRVTMFSCVDDHLCLQGTMTWPVKRVTSARVTAVGFHRARARRPALVHVSQTISTAALNIAL